MYQKGDFIIYGKHGVCRILDVGTPNIHNMKIDVPYYTLSPVYATGLIYVPVSTDMFMRPIISKEEAQKLICRLPEINEAICRNRNVTMLRQSYDKYMETHDCEVMFQIIKGIYLKGQIDKKLGQVDQRYMKLAEELLYGELATALEMPIAEVIPYIEKTVAAIEA